MEGYTLGIIVKAALEYLLKAGSAGLPVLGGAAVIWLLLQGLEVAKSYAEGSSAERGKLLEFISRTQESQSAREERFLGTLTILDKNVALLNQRLEARQQSDDAWQRQTDQKLSKINDDVWKARG